MRSVVEVVAERRALPGRPPGTVLRRLRAGGHFALRETAPGVVHLVGTLAGPLGGDTVDIRVRVGPGARLTLRSVAATLVLPSRSDPHSTLRIDATVEDGGALDLRPEPTIVCAHAAHLAVTTIDLAPTATATVLEQVQLGRAGEPGGEWTGRTEATRDGVPLLRHVLRSAVVAADGARAVVTALALSPGPFAAASTGSAVAMPLAAGGLLATGHGASLAAVRREVEAAVASAHGRERASVVA